jgi:microcystin-dependent protein
MAEGILGEIQIYGFNYPPRGWMLCAGQLLPLRQYTAVFSLLGTYYGGDGQTTFQLPDLRSRVAMGQGQGQGLTDRSIGENGGAENVTLNILQLPMHTHTLTGGGGTVRVSSANGTQPGATPTVNTLGGFEDTTLSATNNAYNSTTPDIALNTGPALSGTIAPQGGNQPFNMMQPTLGLNFSICMEGVFPQRN